MEFRDYMNALAVKIGEVSADRDELDILKWVTASTAELHGVARWLHARHTENTLVALSVYAYGSTSVYQAFQDNLTDAHVEARAKEIAPLLDAIPGMSGADES
jgi:hypothetical protein